MFPVGEHIQVFHIGYTHHGIYIGDNKVIHYGGFHEVGKKDAISITSLLRFCNGETAQKYQMSQMLRGRRFSADEIVRRAKSRLGEDCYHLVFNNCEHFCNWCTHGDDYSYQTAGMVENNVRSGKVGMAGGLGLLDLFAPFKGLFK